MQWISFCKISYYNDKSFQKRRRNSNRDNFSIIEITSTLEVSKEYPVIVSFLPKDISTDEFL